MQAKTLASAQVNVLVKHYSSFTEVAFFQHKLLSAKEARTETMLHNLKLSRKWGGKKDLAERQTLNVRCVSGEFTSLQET